MNKSKKIMCLILCLFWLVGCGSSQNETVDNKQTDNESVESLNKFDTQGTIEKCVLYDENNIKIIKKEIFNMDMFFKTLKVKEDRGNSIYHLEGRDDVFDNTGKKIGTIVADIPNAKIEGKKIIALRTPYKKRWWTSETLGVRLIYEN